MEDQNLHKLQANINRIKSLYQQNQDQREKKYENYCEKIDNLQDKDKFIQDRE